SVSDIRAHFPALQHTYNGFPIAYFDGPGGTQVPRAVVTAMSDYLFNHNANTHWEYPTSVETDEIIAGARAAMADFLNATPGEIAFGQNMTSLTFHLARALGRQWNAGDEIVITELDHHANQDTWRSLIQDRGIVIRQVPMDLETGQLHLDDLANLLNEKTRLVAVGAASNALGTITDVKRATQMAHAAGALCFVDAVHYAPHTLVDVQDIGCDFLACSAYKFYGPHIGILYGRHDLLAAAQFPKLAPSPNNAPDRVETGTQSHESIAGAGAAVNFLASLAGGDTRRRQMENAMAALHARGDALLRQMWTGLSAIDGVRLYGPTPDQPHTPTVSFTLRGFTSAEVARALFAEGVFASNGDFYATTVAERYGVTDAGFLRAGCACYTTEEEVDRLVEGVRKLAVVR
ncbi:MAG: cysteine desulfurase-like protein, partial [Blastocatellia bacterium]